MVPVAVSLAAEDQKTLHVFVRGARGSRLTRLDISTIEKGRLFF